MWRYDKLTPKQKETVDLLRKGWFITNDVEYWHLREFPRMGVVRRVLKASVNSLFLRGVIIKDSIGGYHLNTTEEVK